MQIKELLEKIGEEKGVEAVYASSPFVVKYGKRFLLLSFIEEKDFFDPEGGREYWKASDMTDAVKSLGGNVAIFATFDTSLRKWIEANYPVEAEKFEEQDWFFGGEELMNIVSEIFGDRYISVMQRYQDWVEISTQP